MAKRKRRSDPFTAPSGHEALQPHLDRFGSDHPVYEKNVFIAMRFRTAKQFADIHQAIQLGLAKYGLLGHRADDKTYPADGDLWTNICVYMLGCKYAVCVFEEIDEREFNPNVPLEYGFMRAFNRRVLLLKDQRMPKLPADMTGKVYKAFDSYNIMETIQQQISEWAEHDLGLKVNTAASEVSKFLSRVTDKTVLILGRFTPERKAVLDAVRDQLVRDEYDPVIFDFPLPPGKTPSETILLLAQVSRFIIADLTSPRGIPHELQMIAPLRVPIHAIILSSEREYEFFQDLLQYPWISGPFRYDTQDHLIRTLRTGVVAPLEAKLKDIAG